MFKRSKEPSGLKVRARDWEIGKVKDFYFDDESWTVRYMVADTGGWLTGRRFLISPYALGTPHTDAGIIPVNLDKKEIEESPSIETDAPFQGSLNEPTLRITVYPNTGLDRTSGDLPITRTLRMRAQSKRRPSARPIVKGILICAARQK